MTDIQFSTTKSRETGEEYTSFRAELKSHDDVENAMHILQTLHILMPGPKPKSALEQLVEAGQK